ncbi:cell division protein FtsQ/DivIB [Georgenia alba]|uniref:Cell division protein FtsQ/DivIB n=1 Tax=Georgenia alba TaxID=2233858 RepID=A0ABW2Q8B1_9MICO
MRPPAAPRRRSSAPRSPEPERRREEVVEAEAERPRRAPRPARREVPTVSTGLAARQAERTAAARRLLLRRVGAGLGILVLLVVVAWVLLLSPLLALDEDRVEVAGLTPLVDGATVRSAVEPEVGTPLLRVDTAAVADRVREIDAVEDVQVSRVWPNGLAVNVVARVPVAVAQADGGGWVLVDDDGIQLGDRRQPPPTLPRVTVPLGDSGETGPALDAVLTVLGAVPDDILERVDRAGATSPEQVTLHLGNGATVRWGSTEESALKAEVLRVLLRQDAGVYDVSVPRSPTTSG